MDSVSTYNVINPELVRFHEGTSSEPKDMGEIGNSMENLTKVDLELAYSSEKLLNLESLLLYILSWESDFEALAAESADDDVSVEFIEKSLSVDLLFSFLDSEVKDVDFSMDSIEVDLVEAHQRLSSCKHLGELFAIVEGKLRDSKESLKQSQEHVLEMKMKLAKLQMTSFAFDHSECFSEQISHIEAKPRLQAIDKVHVLRMLEKSLSRELELEKKLTESKQDEEDLKLKLRLTEQVAFIMEEAAEVVWGRFLEAENAAVVLMGVSRDLVARHHLTEFNLNAFHHREDGFRSKLDNCIKLLNSKDASIEKLNSRITQLVAENLEKSTLMATVKALEEKLNESEVSLKKSNESNELSQARVGELEGMVESLKENVYTAETRADLAESKVSQLTESNIELSDELGFLKGSHENNSKKMSLLEKESRELEIQLQHAKATSEVGQELYSAIWDMETLIDELKQKVSTAEMKAETAEDRCLLLTETNSELGKEVEFLRAEVESLETSLSHANLEKMASAKDVGMKTKLIMDTVLQLATERERITKQLHCQTAEKRILMETLQQINKDVYASMYPKGGTESENSIFSSPILKDASLTERLQQNLIKSSLERIKTQVEEIDVLEGNSVDEPEPESSITDSESNIDEIQPQEPPSRTKRMLMFRAIFVLSISVLAVYFFNGEPVDFDV